MSAQIWLAVVAGGALGAPTRLWVDRRCIVRWGATWPVGTLIVNLLGSAVLGLTAGWAAQRVSIMMSGGAGADPAAIMALLGTGFCGALTTFSGFTAQVLTLTHAAPARRFAGFCYAMASLVFGVAFAAIGFAAGA